MADLKTGAKFIEKDPPLADQETKSIGRKILDYLAYLKEQLNFIFSNYGRRLTDADGHINELTRTAEETTSVIYDPQTGLISKIQQNADAISAEVTRATGKEGDLNTAIGANTAAIAVNANAITTKVSTSDYNGNEIVSKINQTATTVDISADKINLNGAVTANNNVQILQDGTIKAVNADLSGKFTMTSGSINITTSSATSDQIRLNYGQNYETYISPSRFYLKRDYPSSSYYNEISMQGDGYRFTKSAYNTGDGPYGALGPTGLYFHDNNNLVGVLRVHLQNGTGNSVSRLMMNDYTGKMRAEYGEQSLNFYEADGTTVGTNIYSGQGIFRMSYGSAYVYPGGVEFTNTSNTRTAFYPGTLTASKALATGTNGTVTTSNVTATELGYLSGVTSAVQTQIGNLQTQINNISISPTHLSGGNTSTSYTAGTYKYSGVSFTVPAGKYFVCTAHAYYSAVSPSAVCISNSSTSLGSGAMQIEGLVDSQNTRARVTWSGYLSSATTYYVWAKSAANGVLGVGLDGFYL